jgi:hypothetical protein
VRVLQEMIAEGWTNEQIAEAVRTLVSSWYDLLTEVAAEAETRFGTLGPFTPREMATLIGNAFMGSEALLLLGFDRDLLPIRTALRRIGVLIRQREEAGADAGSAT